MDKRPASIDSPRQQRGVFVVRWHDDAGAFKTAEVFGESQRYAWTAARIRRVGDHVLIGFRHEGDTRIFDSPDLLRILAGARHQGWFGVNFPSVNAISRTCRAQMRQASPAFG